MCIHFCSPLRSNTLPLFSATVYSISISLLPLLLLVFNAVSRYFFHFVSIQSTSISLSLLLLLFLLLLIFHFHFILPTIPCLYETPIFHSFIDLSIHLVLVEKKEEHEEGGEGIEEGKEEGGKEKRQKKNWRRGWDNYRYIHLHFILSSHFSDIPIIIENEDEKWRRKERRKEGEKLTIYNHYVFYF